MHDPEEPTKVVPAAFHGEGDIDASVVTEAEVVDPEAEDIEQREDDDVERLERSEKAGGGR